jgi:succinyl-CoA synthetase alpha subunit
MRAKKITDLLKKGDRVAVSNITGREASRVSIVSQRYSENIVGGWALGKGGRKLDVDQITTIPVFSDYGELLKKLPKSKHPNKVIIYSPPDAVYGEVKNVITAKDSKVDTLFIITENVSVEVSSKVKNLCDEHTIDVLGCNTLGVINVEDTARVGAVGGDNPEETFYPGSVSIISNSGNMVNTMASYLYGAGIGIRFGISTGKDQLILTPLKDLLKLVMKDDKTSVVVLYIEPGGLYEQEAIEWLKKCQNPKPLVVYAGGGIADEFNLSLGHAGAVVEGKGTSARDKMALFDEYLGIPPYKSGKKFPRGTKPTHGLRIEALHDLPEATRVLYNALKIPRDYRHYNPLKLNPWFKNMGLLGKNLSPKLQISEGTIPPPFSEQYKRYQTTSFGRVPTRRSMRDASHASSNDGATPRIYGHSVLNLMAQNSFAHALILSWTGSPPLKSFEPDLVEKTLIAGINNGPGTISAQAAKLSASAGNEPHTAIIATLAAIGSVHGGNGSKAVKLMIDAFAKTGLENPYSINNKELVEKVAKETALEIQKRKRVARETDSPFERAPCLGHPVYRTDEVNYDPRERVIARYLDKKNIFHSFLHFYHTLAGELYTIGVTRNVLAVNVDAAISCVWLGICWPLLCEKKITIDRVMKIAFLGFVLGRTAGGAAEYLDHNDYGSPMDMRIPVSECESLVMPVD